MSWDIIIFNSKEKIEDFEKFNADNLNPADFNSAFEKHFLTIKKDGDHREIVGEDYTIDYFIDSEPVTNKLVSLYGENGLYEIIYLAKKLGWQIFDTGNGEILNLENPANNGYVNFQNYLKNVLENRTDT